MIFKLELTKEHMDVISVALSEQPAKLVFLTILELQRQIADQQQKPSMEVIDGGKK